MPLGIENIKKFVGFALNLTEQIATSTKDGWQWTDLFNFIDEAAAIPGVVKTWKDVAAELADLTLEERSELNAYVTSEFDIDNDKVEKIVEDALAWAISTISLVQMFTNKKP